MNVENFTQYAILFAIVIAAGAFIAWDAWLDHKAARRDADDTCCPPGYACNKCYYRIGE